MFHSARSNSCRATHSVDGVMAWKGPATSESGSVVAARPAAAARRLTHPEGGVFDGPGARRLRASPRSGIAHGDQEPAGPGGRPPGEAQMGQPAGRPFAQLVSQMASSGRAELTAAEPAEGRWPGGVGGTLQGKCMCSAHPSRSGRPGRETPARARTSTTTRLGRTHRGSRWPGQPPPLAADARGPGPGWPMPQRLRRPRAGAATAG
jgi:hypothetical protein